MAGLLSMGAAPMQQGGLLGTSSQISDEQGKQMAMQLASSPTPETAMKLASQLSNSGSQELMGIARFLSENANDQQALMHLAQSVLQ